MPRGRRHKHVRRNRPHSFSEVPQVRIPRSRFDRSHGLKTTFDAGYLVPVFVDEVLPGDTFNLSMTAFARMATPIKPIMDNLYLESFFFFVPNRLVWDNWQRFMGEEPNPGDSTDFLVPRMTDGVSNTGEGTLSDYFGIPLGINRDGNLRRVNALPFRAYNLIWNEWFRDQNLQNRRNVEKGDGTTPSGDYVLLKRGKRHDYFTSALPWPQKGESVSLPITGTLAGEVYSEASLGTPGGIIGVRQGSASGTVRRMVGDSSDSDWVKMHVDTVTADNRLKAESVLDDSVEATINQLRQAFQVQRLLERNARGGTRYTEILRSHFGVSSPDQRLQRPEYLGGGRSMVQLSPVAQTSSTDATTEQGNLAAIGTAVAHNHGFVKSFVEHGHIIGLVSVRADLNYQQGLHRMWSRRTRFDYYWPALSRIGEQAVLSREIFVGNDSGDGDVFGYQERYAEYRYKPSQVTGLFRSGASGSLDLWHLSQEFGSRPVLNSGFIQEDPPIDRVIAVPEEPHFIMDTFFSLKCARPMPVFGVPGMIDHF